MGMYTELFFSAEFKAKLSDVDEGVIQFLFGSAERPQDVLKHRFFERSRAYWMFNSPRYAGPGVTLKIGDYYRHVTAHIELKNYEVEIEAFLDWVRPLLDNPAGTCIGWTWYEENDNPTLIYA